MSMIRTRWAAVGAAVAVTLGAGGLSMAQAAISSGEKPVYVSLDAPCRVVDTRESTKIGPGDDESLDVQITGSNGACTGPLAIPTDAVGVSTNVTVIQPSDSASGRSYFTVYPTGATRPVTSNLNFVNGQAPTPNKVDVGIGTGGKITIYNNEGAAHAAVDIFGYYIDHNHDDRYYTEGEVDTKLGTKANAADVYTKAQTDAALADKVSTGQVLSAVVAANGTLIRGIGAVSAANTFTGNYVVDFGKDVTQCVFTATPGETGSSGSVSGRIASVAGANGQPNAVFIRTEDLTPTNVNTSIHLTVICPPSSAPASTSQTPSAGADAAPNN